MPSNTDRPTSRANAAGPSLVTLLLAAFIFCKVAGVTAIASWSWWWVLSPLWIVLGLGVAALLIAVALALVVGVVKGFRR